MMETTNATQEPTRREVWLRGLFMLVLIIAFGVGQFLTNVTAVVQFLWLMFTGEPNRTLVHFGASLAQWFSQTVEFLTCESEEKPFPWKDWPSSGGGDYRDERV